MKEPSDDGPKREPPVLSRRILRYVLATCYPLINRRLKHRLSRSYIQAVAEVTTFQFSESEYNRKSATAEIEGDRRFLVDYLLPSSLASIWETKIPKLMEQAQLARDRKPFQLYTNETCIEFHQLFLEILKRFETSLDELARTRGSEKIPTQGSKEFERYVSRVLIFGDGLQTLVRSAGLKIHLKTITPLLMNCPILRSDSEMSVLSPGTEQGLGLDEDLEAVRPFSSKEGVEVPLWKSYIDWLELMIIHFNSVGILVHYVTGPYFHHETISIRILVAPPVDRRLLPWQELLTDSTLFPTYSTGLHNLSGWGITNAEIIEFLSKALETSSKAEAAKATWDKKGVKDTILNIETVQSSKLPCWEKRAAEILVKLRGLDNLSPSADLFQEISSEIQSLCEGSAFFTSLGNTQDFSGTLHGEACLVSVLNDSATTASKDVVAQMKVGYVPNLFLFSQSHRISCELERALDQLLDHLDAGA